uniref:Nuclear receptor domain-containing protein n=1 Tax=Acrobeloides nanus TaxID=290746 RepID=A0A914CL80_9BILA
MSSASNPGTSQLLPEEEICLVCNDHSTGYHYGVPSCNGCKTFFRRTIMKKQVFKCQYNGNCNVDKTPNKRESKLRNRGCSIEASLGPGLNRYRYFGNYGKSVIFGLTGISVSVIR